VGTAVALVAVVLVGGVVVLVRSSDADSDDAALPPAASNADTADNAESTSYADVPWTKVEPAGDCHCADGSDFFFWDRPADPGKVVVFLNGGGVCWDARTCAFTSEDSPGENDFYGWSMASTDPDRDQGLFDFDNADNPFADYSFLYVNSCTGDAHLGDATREYSPDLTVEHNGLTNGTAALSYLADTYADADQVVVIGKTAGSVAAPVYGGLVADLLPDARVTVFGAQSGAWPDNPDFNAQVLDAQWGASAAMPDWEVNEGLTVADWSVPRFWAQAGLHDPDLVLARFDFAYDPHAAVEVTEWMADDPPDLLAETDGNEAAIEAAGVDLHSYTAPGEGHGIFEFDDFYDLEVDGVRMVDWLDALADGEPVDDVHCDDCAEP
jgi:hypothetical protein